MVSAEATSDIAQKCVGMTTCREPHSNVESGTGMHASTVGPASTVVKPPEPPLPLEPPELDPGPLPLPLLEFEPEEPFEPELLPLLGHTAINPFVGSG